MLPKVRAAVPLLAIVKVSLSGLPSSGVLPNAVSLVALVVVEPSEIGWLLPVTPMCAVVVATPLMAKVKGLVAVGSFSLKLTVALRVPPAVGLNCTVKVVLPPTATEPAGWLGTG